ncbi:DUF5719 domain-containing protein [Sulfidibacter corallicola]|uniref:Uncharacterized protein n=1 Tax=Sulfidibacter corallicola TaxID=2818388 RepID=A0A8A4TTC4_SULCO|nr:hypothetical protein [Sulfidibacter corallicola]QTD53216.1 hypothetical protein J3U87_12235 [Sulfidibacter corallicola]
MKWSSLFPIALCTLLSTTLWAGEWVVPWLSNRDGEWSSAITINNHGTEPVTYSLHAVRANGESQTIDGLSIGAQGQVILDAADTFDQLGSGGGFALFVSSSSDSLSIGAKVASLNTASQDSPALAGAINAKNAYTRLVFPSMPYAFGANSAAVLVNMGDEPIDVVLQLFGTQGLLLTSAPITLQPRTPSPQLMALVFPELVDDTYIVVDTQAPLIGAAFNFNAQNEPSLMNAEPVPTADLDELTPLLMAMDTAGTLASGYGDSTEVVLGKNTPSPAVDKREDCPAITREFNPTQEESFLTATLDYGTGCTSMFGVFHSGSVSLTLSREGSLTAGWMSGMLGFDEFVTRYQGENFSIDGQVRAEGSTATRNFTLAGDWRAEADSDRYGVYGQVDAEVFLSANWRDNMFEVYGSYQTDITNSGYQYSISGEVPQNDPLQFDFATCIWPIDGTVTFTVTSGYSYSGSIDFGTGDCQTAVVTVAGQSQTLDLSGIY